MLENERNEREEPHATWHMRVSILGQRNAMAEKIIVVKFRAGHRLHSRKSCFPHIQYKNNKTK